MGHMTVVEAGRKGGKVKSPQKTKSAEKNGQKGGAPYGNQNNPKKR